VAIEAMRFLRPIAVGDEVSCYCTLVDEGNHSISVKIETWAASRAGEETEKVTEGVFRLRRGRRCGQAARMARALVALRAVAPGNGAGKPGLVSPSDPAPCR
jgi:hypothetical protein